MAAPAQARLPARLGNPRPELQTGLRQGLRSPPRAMVAGSARLWAQWSLRTRAFRQRQRFEWRAPSWFRQGPRPPNRAPWRRMARPPVRTEAGTTPDSLATVRPALRLHLVED